MSNQHTAQEAAEKAISIILRDLEVETGCLVERLSVESLDITNMRDDNQQLIRRASLELRRQPGTRWRV